MYSVVVWAHMCSRLLAVYFGLRQKELCSANIEPESDERLICIEFHPKGDRDAPRVKAWRWACGVLGPFFWWPRYRSLLGGYKTLYPSWRQPGSDVVGGILTAASLHSSPGGYESDTYRALCTLGGPDQFAIIRAFHVINLSLRANVWFNYVASKANVADLPSRGDSSEMAFIIRGILPGFDLEADRLPLRFPECPLDPSESWGAAVDALSSAPGRPSAPPASSARRARGGKRPRPGRAPPPSRPSRTGD